jgi:hypothetical protein
MILKSFAEAAAPKPQALDYAVIFSLVIVVALTIEQLVLRTSTVWASVYQNDLLTLLVLIVLFFGSKAAGPIGKAMPGAMATLGNLNAKSIGGLPKYAVAILIVMLVAVSFSLGAQSIFPMIAPPQAVGDIGGTAVSGYLLLTGGTGVLEELTHVILFLTVMNAVLDSAMLFPFISSVFFYFAFPQFGWAWIASAAISIILMRVNIKNRVPLAAIVGLVYSGFYFASLHANAAAGEFMSHFVFRSLVNIIAVFFGLLPAIGIHIANNAFSRDATGTTLLQAFGLPHEFGFVPVLIIIALIFVVAKYGHKVVRGS